MAGTEKNVFRLCFCTVLSILMLVCAACASNSAGREADPDFLGDYDPVQAAVVSAQTLSFGSAKAREVALFFAPRTNTVELRFSEAISKIQLELTAEHRRLLLQAALAFMRGYEEGSLEDRKPTRRNAYSESGCVVTWGITGSGHRAEDAGIRFNHRFLPDGRPYFMVDLQAGNDLVMDGVKSPQTDLYFSPAQLEELCAATDRAALEELLAGLESGAEYGRGGYEQE